MTRNPDKHHQQVTRLLTQYLRTAWEAAGLGWDHDNDTEVALIADAVVAMVEKRVRGHEEWNHDGVTF